MTPWPASILPQDRDGRWNHLATGIACLYRALGDGEAITCMTVTVMGPDGERVVTYPGADGVAEAAGLECGRGEEEAC